MLDEIKELHKKYTEEHKAIHEGIPSFEQMGITHKVESLKGKREMLTKILWDLNIAIANEVNRNAG